MQLLKPLFFATFWLLCHFTANAIGVKAKFTKVEYGTNAEEFATFKYCYLKPIARDKVAFYLHLQIHQLPLTKIVVNAELYQKGNGYRPFMYNDTLDFCVFKLRASRFMFWKILYDAAVGSTNINHSCPYNHDLIIDRLILNSDMFRLIPFPPNDYQIRLNWIVSNNSSVEVRLFLKIYD